MGSLYRQLDARLPRFGARPLRLATLLTAICSGLIVVSGGLVRVSNSGLGCPTWPRCTDQAVTSVGLGINGWIEFGNRCLTTAVSTLVLVAAALVWRQRERRRDLTWPAIGIVAGLFAEIVLGGLTVLFKLAPALVASHFLLSMLFLWNAVVLHTRVGRTPGPTTLDPRVGPELRVLGIAVQVVAAGVLAVGTLVSGTGPISGGGHHARFGFALRAISQAHADSAMLLTGVVAAVVLVVRTKPVPELTRRRGTWLGLAVLAQAALGFTQYFLDLPATLVLLHIAGATTLWTLTLGLRSSFVASEPNPGLVAPERARIRVAGVVPG